MRVKQGAKELLVASHTAKANGNRCSGKIIGIIELFGLLELLAF